MALHALLDNVTHHALKISPFFKSEFGDNVNTALTFSTELEAMQRVYPLFFRKDHNNNQFQLVAMLGFEKDENLFLDQSTHTWQAEVIPATIAKGPFLIGFQDQSNRGGAEQAPVVHIDLESPRIDNNNGIPVFLEHGGNSQYLEHINSLLLTIYHGMSDTKSMLAAFSKLELIEPVELEITLNNGDTHKLHGNYTISTEKLVALSGKNLQQLNQSGYLKAAFFIAASLNNVKKLIAIKNSK